MFYCVMTNSVGDQENDASYYAKPQTNYHCCLQFSFCFHALDWLFPSNTITFMITVIFYVTQKMYKFQPKCVHIYVSYLLLDIPDRIYQFQTFQERLTAKAQFHKNDHCCAENLKIKHVSKKNSCFWVSLRLGLVFFFLSIASTRDSFL